MSMKSDGGKEVRKSKVSVAWMPPFGSWGWGACGEWGMRVVVHYSAKEKKRRSCDLWRAARPSRAEKMNGLDDPLKK